jgi:hypothetical protein
MLHLNSNHAQEDSMAILPALQQNPLFQRQVNRQANRDARLAFLANPLAFLAQTPVTCQVGTGHQTVLNPAVQFCLDNGTLKIGAHAANVLNGGAITVPALQSSTRASSGPHFINRLAATARFPIGSGAEFWTTDQQTGCTVIALDWGGQYSLFHLLPYTDATYSRWKRTVFSVSRAARAELKNSTLRSEATQVTNASIIGGALPLRYILLQSMHNITSGLRMQTIGVERNNDWEFYRQIQSGVAGGLVVQSAVLAPWRPWSEYFYWDV